MDERIRAAFDGVRATEAQKEQTRAFLARARRRRAAPRRSLGTLAACVALLAVLVGGYWAWFVPTSAISVAGSDTLELAVNRFDRVVEVRCGDRELADALRGLDYEQALTLLLDRLAEDQTVSITVAGEQRQCGRLLAGAEACAAGRENVHCGQGQGNAGQGQGHGYGHHGAH